MRQLYTYFIHKGRTRGSNSDFKFVPKLNTIIEKDKIKHVACLQKQRLSNYQNNGEDENTKIIFHILKKYGRKEITRNTQNFKTYKIKK